MARSFFFALAMLAFAIDANAQQRWILAGDSIMAGVFENEEFGLPGGDAAQLTSTIVALETGVSIQNVSSPGATMSLIPPWQFPGVSNQRSAVAFIDGLFGATGIIITVGVNDAGQPAITPTNFYNDYFNFVTYARSLALKVVCVIPLNEPNQPTNVNASRRYYFQLLAYFACTNAGVPVAQVYNPAADGIFPDPANAAKRRLFASSIQGTQLVLDNIHLSSDGHALFAEKLIDFMVARGFWTRN